ncbi:MAG TPA: cytochrome c [Steroidobacteraceae bacterium]|nr:cytochrome c [Steroidobacteraceae bacterium]
MKKFLKWTGFVVAGLAGVLLIALAWVFFASSRELGRHYTVADGATRIPTDAVNIAEGKRIAQLAGCMHCHGEKLQGGLVDDIPNLVRLVAPNISVKLPDYTNDQLATVLRKGVKPDGTSVMFMPSEMYRHLGDEDLGRLIAFLRTMPVTTEGVQEKTEVRIIGRVLLAAGEFKPAAASIPAMPDAIRGFDSGDVVSRGQHLTMTFCSECHGQSLEGFAPINAPALSVAKGYSLDQFARLLHDGVPLGDRELKLMGPTSQARFASFTPDEVAAVHAYLQSRS